MLGKRLTCRGRRETETSPFVEGHEDVQQAQAFVQVEFACLCWTAMKGVNVYCHAGGQEQSWTSRGTVYHPSQSRHCQFSCTHGNVLHSASLLCLPPHPLLARRGSTARQSLAERSVHVLDAAHSWHCCLLAGGHDSSLRAAAHLPST